MRNLYFPTTIIDGFFEDPDVIRDYALKQEFFSSSEWNGPDTLPNYPGKRTASIEKLNPLLYHTINKKFMDLFFPTGQITVTIAHMAFQSISQHYGSGWVHRDYFNIATAVIYLSKHEGGKNTGTSLYTKKDAFNDSLHNSSLKNAKQMSFKHEIDDRDSREKTNSNFQEVLTINGLYNRAVLFDSHFYHAAQNFAGGELNDSRLSIIVFFDEIITSAAELFPIQRMHKKAYTII